MSHLSPQFIIGPSTQNDHIDQSGQTDLSNSQIDLNSNIEINYPDTSASWDDTYGYDVEENGASFVTGSGNDTGNDDTGYTAQDEYEGPSGNPEMEFPFYFEKDEFN